MEEQDVVRSRECWPWKKYHWVLLIMLSSFCFCETLIVTILTLSDYAPRRSSTESFTMIPKFGRPPAGHPWHQWASDSIDARLLVKELALIDTLSLNESYNDPNMRWDGDNGINATFNPPFYRTLMPFVVKEGTLFHPKRKETMLNTKRWKHFQTLLFDSLNLAKSLQHVDPRIRAVATGSFPVVLAHSDHVDCNDYRGKHIPIFGWFTIRDASSCNYSWPVPDYHFYSFKKKNETEWDAQFEEWNNEYPWSSKQKKAGWRGTMTGPTGLGGDWHKLPRAKLVQRSIINDKNTTMDAGFVEHAIAKRSKWEKGAIGESLMVPRIQFNDFMKYRAIIDIDGNAWSSRYGLILCFNSVIIKVREDDCECLYYSDV